MELRNGDVIDIPSRPGTVRVYGEVMSPTSLRFESNLKVDTVVARSGGYSQQADRQRVFVVRADGSVVATGSGKGTEWNTDKRSWMATTLSSISLREGDAVIVPPDLTYKPSWRVVAKDLTQILFQVSVAAATVIAVAP
jgi:polysaccharide export outer membrane protein